MIVSDSSSSESDNDVPEYTAGDMALCKAFGGTYLCQLTDNIDTDNRTAEVQFWNRATANDKFLPSWQDTYDEKEMFCTPSQASSYAARKNTVLAKSVFTVDFADICDHGLQMENGFPPSDSLRKICKKNKKSRRGGNRKR